MLCGLRIMMTCRTNHLVGESGVLRECWKSTVLFHSLRFAGLRKTTIAAMTCKMAGYPWYRFNASTDTKDKLKQIVNEARFNEATLIIVDEIHRMKKDIQDFLLPYVEDGTLIMIGLTTVNPYHAVNPAIRSRVHIYKLHDLTNDDLAEIIRRATKQLEFKGKIPDDVINYLIQLSGGKSAP